jgi:hypothetical protein
MFRLSLMSIFLFSFLAGALVVSAQRDYIDQLIQLTELTDSQQYREAINGYKKLESQPGAPEWLKAGAEYEIAEVYAALNETDNAIAASITPCNSASTTALHRAPASVSRQF